MTMKIPLVTLCCLICFLSPSPCKATIQNSFSESSFSFSSKQLILSTVTLRGGDDTDSPSAPTGESVTVTPATSNNDGPETSQTTTSTSPVGSKGGETTRSSTTTRAPVFGNAIHTAKQTTIKRFRKAGRWGSLDGLKNAVEDLKHRHPKLQIKEMDSIAASDNLMDSFKQGSNRALEAVGPIAGATVSLFYQPEKTLLTLPSIIALTLMCTSSGFYLFLYFITVGYALGVAVPVLAALVAYNLQHKPKLSSLTNVHSGLVVAWGVRAAWFFLYRERVSWPELHTKVVEVNKTARINAKLFCWFVFSSFYVAMMSPCLHRLNSIDATWGKLGKFAIGLQTFGLLLETISDLQKSAFKSQPGNRNRWCHEGLWKYSTHPNYLGEISFWIGTFLGGIGCYKTTLHWAGSVIGLLFILTVMRGAISSLGAKQLRKYGNDVEFLEFRRTHSVLGPFRWPPQPKESVSL